MIGYPTLTPFLAVNDAAAAVEFYEAAFGARPRRRVPAPGGKLAHVELELGTSIVMLADPSSISTATAPPTLGGTSVGLHLYVDDVDAVFARAVSGGATVVLPVADMFWGDRYGKLLDPFGHEWRIATRIEDLTERELALRVAAQLPGGADGTRDRA